MIRHEQQWQEEIGNGRFLRTKCHISIKDYGANDTKNTAHGDENYKYPEKTLKRKKTAADNKEVLWTLVTRAESDNKDKSNFKAM